MVILNHRNDDLALSEEYYLRKYAASQGFPIKTAEDLAAWREIVASLGGCDEE